MLYQRKVFTLPANTKSSQRQWDFAMLSRGEFLAKYGADSEEYVEVAVVEFHTDHVPATLPEHSGSVLVVMG